MAFTRRSLDIDVKSEQERIMNFIQKHVRSRKKDGIVVGLSGGIDSALISILCVKALGRQKVFGLILPEKESNPVSRKYAEKQAKRLDIDYEVIDITETLESFGVYNRRDNVIRSLFKDYDDERHRIKITLPADILNNDTLNIFTLQILEEGKPLWTGRLHKRDLNRIIAATDIKQRTRMVYLYYYAESMNRLVCGTTNRPETLQGFFVKHGDGGVDLEPIAHLYKTQVFQLSKELCAIDEIIQREPSPDTFNSYVGDEEFYFRMPYEMVDLLLYTWENDVPLAEVEKELGLTEVQIKRAYRDFTSKFNSTEHLRKLPPSLM